MHFSEVFTQNDQKNQNIHKIGGGPFLNFTTLFPQKPPVLISIVSHERGTHVLFVNHGLTRNSARSC